MERASNVGNELFFKIVGRLSERTFLPLYHTAVTVRNMFLYVLRWVYLQTCDFVLYGKHLFTFLGQYKKKMSWTSKTASTQIWQKQYVVQKNRMLKMKTIFLTDTRRQILFKSVFHSTENIVKCILLVTIQNMTCYML